MGCSQPGPAAPPSPPYTPRRGRGCVAPPVRDLAGIPVTRIAVPLGRGGPASA